MAVRVTWSSLALGPLEEAGRCSVAAGGATPDPPDAAPDGGASAVAGLEACVAGEHPVNGCCWRSQACEAVTLLQPDSSTLVDRATRTHFERTADAVEALALDLRLRRHTCDCKHSASLLRHCHMDSNATSAAVQVRHVQAAPGTCCVFFDHVALCHLVPARQFQHEQQLSRHVQVRHSAAAPENS